MTTPRVSKCRRLVLWGEQDPATPVGDHAAITRRSRRASPARA